MRDGKKLTVADASTNGVLPRKDRHVRRNGLRPRRRLRAFHGLGTSPIPYLPPPPISLTTPSRCNTTRPSPPTQPPQPSTRSPCANSSQMASKTWARAPSAQPRTSGKWAQYSQAQNVVLRASGRRTIWRMACWRAVLRGGCWRRRRGRRLRRWGVRGLRRLVRRLIAICGGRVRSRWWEGRKRREIEGWSDTG